MTTSRGQAATELLVYESGSALARATDVVDLYREVYAEPPYCEGPDDFEAFEKSWPRRVEEPRFRLVLVQQGSDVVGFTFGHQLPPTTKWWSGVRDPFPADLTTEYPGRTFAIIELAVRANRRRAGIGRALHDALIANHPEQRIALLSLPSATAAQKAYRAWGYEVVARSQRSSTLPVYDCLVLHGQTQPELHS